MATSSGMFQYLSFPVATATVITAGKAVVLNASGQLAHAGAAAKGVIGIAQVSSDNKTNNPIRVAVINGAKINGITGTAGVTNGDLLTSDAAGDLVEAQSGEPYFGVATETRTDGQLVQFVSVTGVA